MYTSYNIPQNESFNQINRHHFDNNDRFLGSGFLGPFILGGVGGYLLGRPNYYNNGPIPVIISNRPPYPYPYPYYY